MVKSTHLADIPPEWGRWLKPREIAKLAYDAGWTDAKKLVVAIAIALAESNGYEHRWHDNTDKDGNVVSRDRGLWMINDKAHPNISDERAYNAWEATKVARGLYGIHGFEPWSSYGNGQYKAAHALGYAFDGVSNFLREEHGVPIPKTRSGLNSR